MTLWREHQTATETTWFLSVSDIYSLSDRGLVILHVLVPRDG